MSVVQACKILFVTNTDYTMQSSWPSASMNILNTFIYNLDIWRVNFYHTDQFTYMPVLTKHTANPLNTWRNYNGVISYQFWGKCLYYCEEWASRKNGLRSKNELQRAIEKVPPGGSPSNGHQGDMPYWKYRKSKKPSRTVCWKKIHNYVYMFTPPRRLPATGKQFCWGFIKPPRKNCAVLIFGKSGSPFCLQCVIA